ncbi:glutamine-rich protein 2 [Apteryx mantelli]|uniref:Glutamine-rich protein 2 n=1 Tax=Apteryx mantelli TaxID=2696672 RepID=A0ABM4FIF7_9AVES
MAQISLHELADLAIGMPEVGAVNFNALHSLLHAILQHLDLQDVKMEMQEESLKPLAAPAPLLERAQLLEKEKPLYNSLEKKVVGVEAQLQGMGQQLQELEKQMATLEKLPSGMDLLERTKSSSQATSVVADMWQMMQMKKKIEANESGVSKAMALFQDLLTEMSGVKTIQLHVEEDIQRIKELLGSVTPRDAEGRPPGLLRDQARPDRDTVRLRAWLRGGASPCCHSLCKQELRWVHGSDAGADPGIQHHKEAKMGRSSPGEPPGAAAEASGIQPSPRGGTPGTQPDSLGTRAGMPGAPATQMGPPTDGTRASDAGASTPGAQAGSPGTGATIPGAQPGSPGTQATVPGAQPGSPGTQTTIPGAQPGSPGTQATIAGTQPRSPGTQTSVSGAQPGSLGTGATVSGTQPGSPGTHATIPGSQPGFLGTGATVSGTQPGSPDTQTTIPGAQPGFPGTVSAVSGIQPGSPGTQATTAGTQPGSPHTGATIPGTQPAPPGVQAGGAGVQPRPLGSRPSLPDAQSAPPEARLGAPGARTDAPSPEEGREALPSTQGAPAGSPTAQRGPPTADSTATAHQPETLSGTDARTASSLRERDVLAMPRESAGSPSASGRHAELEEDLRQVGQLSSLYAALKEQVAQLELTKCDRAELEKLRLLFLEADQKSSPSVLDDLLDQVASLQTVASDLQGEKAKIKQLQNIVERMAVAGVDQKAEGTNQINLQLGCLRSMVQEIEKELKELREQQDGAKAKLEQSVTKVADHLQEQLNKLRSVMENMMASSSALLSMSVPASPELRQEEAQGTCPACSLDVSEQVRQLFQRYEQLQHLVNSFMARQAEIKAARQLTARNQQDEELLKHIQATILQVQEDCEKLNSITGDLVDDHRQKQKDIEALFQSLEKLEKEKADKEDLVTEIHVKADKASLAGKVSCTQFDATMEHLNKMIQDVLDRITGQEQDWHQIQQKLVEEMDSKLDRLELTPFRQRLEERWKNLLKQLQEKAPRMEADDAAGIRKQLLAHFHCVSCDRSLNMLVPGPHVLAIPSMPALPSRHSMHPHTVFELEQIRQHSRSLRSGPAGPRSPLDAALLERGARSPRYAHDQLSRHVEPEQLRYGGSAGADSPTMRDLLQLPCLGPARPRERAAECGYLRVPRRCGGRHTLAHPLRRCARLRHLAPCGPGQPEPDPLLALVKVGTGGGGGPARSRCVGRPGPTGGALRRIPLSRSARNTGCFGSILESCHTHVMSFFWSLPLRFLPPLVARAGSLALRRLRLFWGSREFLLPFQGHGAEGVFLNGAVMAAWRSLASSSLGTELLPDLPRDGWETGRCFCPPAGAGGYFGLPSGQGKHGAGCPKTSLPPSAPPLGGGSRVCAAGAGAAPCFPFQHDEVELLGQDGHVYKGRRDARLPAIAGKDGRGPPRTRASCPLGPAVPRRRAAPQAPPGRPRTGQRRRTVPCPTLRAPPSRRGREGTSLQPKSPPRGRAGERAAPPRWKPSNKGRWEAAGRRGAGSCSVPSPLRHPSAGHGEGSSVRPSPLPGVCKRFGAALQRPG